MAKRDRKCICCQSKYQYCPTCGPDIMKPSYMSTFCSDECKTLWEAATKYNVDMISKSEAKAIIEKLELKERSVYVECVQRDLEVILEPEVIVEEKKILEEEPKAVVETAPILEEVPSPKKKQKSHEVVKKEYK